MPPPFSRRFGYAAGKLAEVPFHASHRTYTMPPMRRAWQWVFSDSQRFCQSVSYSSWDTEYQPMGQHIEHIQYELDMGPCALMRPFG